jgi:hypothetical protein
VSREAFTVIDGQRAVAINARRHGDRVLLEPAGLKEALGWEIHDGLLCNDAMCIPLADESALTRDGGVDLAALAAALDRAVAVDLGARARPGDGLAARARLHVPDLAGRPHALGEHRGKKILLVAWASWWRVPSRPAGLAGALRGSEGPWLHGHHRGA